MNGRTSSIPRAAPRTLRTVALVVLPLLLVPLLGTLLVRALLPDDAAAGATDPKPLLPPVAAVAPDAGRRAEPAPPVAEIRPHAARPAAARDDHPPVDADAREAAGAIEGAVVDDRGRIVQSFTVGIESSTAPERAGARGGARPVDDVRGAFRFDELAPGTYVLTASAPGTPPTRSEAVDVASGATSQVRIVLLPGGTVVGTVYDEHRDPVAGAAVRFDAVSSAVDSTAEAKTDDRGRYRLEGAPAGPFTLLAAKEGFRVHMLSGLRVDSGLTLTEDLTLTTRDGGGGLELGGVGAALAPRPEGITLGAVFPGEPAARAGLRAGDRVLSVDGEGTAGMSLADVLQALRGEPGTTVGVSVLRPDTGERIDVVVVRAAIVR